MAKLLLLDRENKKIERNRESQKEIIEQQRETNKPCGFIHVEHTAVYTRFLNLQQFMA
jgi:hypothetical protein